MTQCGAATVIPRRGSIFPHIQGLESCKKWLRNFFYVKNSSAADKINLPGFEVGPPEEKRNWSYDPKETNPEVNEIHAAILELKEEGMTAYDLLVTFVYRRLCPLQCRLHKMCFYNGQFDPDRVSTVRLDQVQVRRQVKAIAKTSLPEHWNRGMPAYSRKHRAPLVCMNKRTAAFKGLLGKYKELAMAQRRHPSSEATEARRQVQDEKTRLAEQHREDVARLQAQISAQTEAHKTEVGELTSTLSTQADERILLENEVKKCKGLVAETETCAVAAEKEDAEKTRRFQVVRHELIKIEAMLTKSFPQSVETAEAAVIKARKKRDPIGTTPFEYDLEDYLVSIASRVKPLKSCGVNMLNAGIRAFRALWPGEEAPTGIPELATRLLEVGDRLNEWRESAAHVGADEALSFVLSWYDGINLDVL
ncbi:uncharacterized protein LOC112268638 [Brachypodium distachyon]|uniref:uncharacterized protein LOC112268638 n=1 Tax=Brachypodium distachyon TaxID=15368 RepID=UPI000D0D13EB|nr:uncharacterized protein LOC112268638 [Brachypodium distachyon]|eukprot:XP_024310315.1 uncharacterized protein LOC112268638 [Brachypodium distachyon]